MSETGSGRTRFGKVLRASAISLAAVTAAAFGLLGCQSVAASSPGDVARGDNTATTWKADGAVTQADGVLPNGVTVFDDRYPGITNLDHDLLRAMRDAASAAADDGVRLFVSSAWRSPEYQAQLLDEAIVRYGSKKKAARWVAPVKTSAHVSGLAVDYDSEAAKSWLSKHGAHHGLCRVYRNEPWHYELRPQAISGRCPRLYTDVSRDPRMQP